MDKSEYENGDNIIVTGEVSEIREGEPILLQFRNPTTGIEYFIEGFDVVTSDKKFKMEIPVGEEEIWKYPGAVEFWAHYKHDHTDSIWF